MNEQIRNQGLTFIRKKKIATLNQLATLFNCSVRTVQRQMRSWGVLTSYNKNCRYYTLPDIPQYNNYGLWHCHDVSFSKHGNLKDTIVQIVQKSESGISGSELGLIVKLNARSFLSHFRDDPRLKREQNGIRLIYFSSNPAVYQCQKEQLKKCQVRQPSDAEAVAILVELIKHPDLTIESLCIRLRNQNLTIGSEMAERFFAFHGLEQKKTPHSQH